jgi:hypothetical protein
VQRDKQKVMREVWRPAETLTQPPLPPMAAVLIKIVLASSASSDIQFSLSFRLAIKQPCGTLAVLALAERDLCQVRAFLHCRFRLMLKKNSEHEYMRNQQQRHYQSRKEERGSQLPCQ